MDINSPHRNLLLEEDRRHSADHIEKSDPLAVNIEAKESYIDGFIDDIFTITADNKYWVEGAKIAALLVIHTLFRPLQASEPLKRDDPLSLRKIAGGGQLAEHKTFIGCYINTHSLRVYISKENQTAWVNDIKDV